MPSPAPTRAVLLAALCAAVACSGSDDAPARVTIPVGASMRVAADSLARAGVVGSSRLFRMYAKVRRSDRAVKAGTYLLRRDASWESVLASLREGRGLVATVLVPEGFTLAQIQELLVAKLGLAPESVQAAVTDTALRHRLDVPTPTIEGYLFPDTYFFPPGTTARAAVAAMVRRFEQRWHTGWGLRLDTLAISRHDVVTLASIVEREAKLAEERPVIAAVYWNRLRRGMLLQADPTVQYALPQYQRRLLNRHLEVQSPYNTYRNRGLPPGPIGSPGAASLQATLYPAAVHFLYFVAFPDGHHEFRVRLEDHQAAARQARRAWRAAAQTPATKAPAPASPRTGARSGR